MGCKHNAEIDDDEVKDLGGQMTRFSLLDPRGEAVAGGAEGKGGQVGDPWRGRLIAWSRRREWRPSDVVA